jgi:hypothetical protein
MDWANRKGQSVTTAQVSSGCAAKSFAATPDDVPIAYGLLRTPTDSALLNVASLRVGAGVVF